MPSSKYLKKKQLKFKKKSDIETHFFPHISVLCMRKYGLSYDVASGSEIKPCIKIDKPLVVYRFSGNVF